MAPDFPAWPIAPYCPGMPGFSHDGVEIAFLDEGEGEPIVLVHGFASNKEVNWVAPGWVTTLTRPWRLVETLRSRRLSQHHHGRRRARADRSSRPAARRRHGLFHGRAEYGVPRAGQPRTCSLRRARRCRRSARRRGRA